jgi:hypothetical protein
LARLAFIYYQSWNNGLLFVTHGEILISAVSSHWRNYKLHYLMEALPQNVSWTKKDNSNFPKKTNKTRIIHLKWSHSHFIFRNIFNTVYSYVQNLDWCYILSPMHIRCLIKQFEFVLRCLIETFIEMLDLYFNIY